MNTGNHWQSHGLNISPGDTLCCSCRLFSASQPTSQPAAHTTFRNDIPAIQVGISSEEEQETIRISDPFNGTTPSNQLLLGLIVPPQLDRVNSGFRHTQTTTSHNKNTGQTFASSLVNSKHGISKVNIQKQEETEKGYRNRNKSKPATSIALRILGSFNFENQSLDNLFLNCFH